MTYSIAEQVDNTTLKGLLELQQLTVIAALNLRGKGCFVIVKESNISWQRRRASPVTHT